MFWSVTARKRVIELGIKRPFKILFSADSGTFHSIDLTGTFRTWTFPVEKKPPITDGPSKERERS